MKEKKNIDRIFQEKFKDYEVSPDAAVWNRIRKDLKKEKKVLPLFPIWVKFGGVAAALALLFLAGKFLFFNPTETNAVKTVKSSSPKPEIDTPQTTPVLTPDQIVGSPNEEAEKSKRSAPQTEGKVHTEPTYTSTTNQKNSEPSTPAIVDSPNHETLSSLLTPPEDFQFIMPTNLQDYLHTLSFHQDIEEKTEEGQNPEKQEEGRSLFDEIARQEEEKDTDKPLNTDESNRRFALQPHIAPIYYSSIGGGSALDPQFAENRTKGKVTTSYGINFDYRVSNRIQLRSGINKVNLQYNTPDIAYLSSQPSMGIQALRTNDEIQNTVIISTVSKKLQTQASPQSVTKIATASAYTEGELHQEMSYLEIPLELVYTLMDQRFGIHLVGGTSALVLNNDNIQIHSDLETKELGRAENINSTSFTGNLGIGFSYRLSSFMDINLEPTFKYQFNGFSGKTGDFRPYYLGLYSGVRFKF